MSRPAETYRAARRNQERAEHHPYRVFYRVEPLVKRGTVRKWFKGKTYGAKPLVQMSSTSDYMIGGRGARGGKEPGGTDSRQYGLTSRAAARRKSLPLSVTNQRPPM
jgi:hypothetical protein